MAPQSHLTSELLQGPLVNPDRTMAYPFYVYFRNGEEQADQGPTRIGTPVSLENQSTSIGTTAITGEAITAGLYRVTYYARITIADGVSSSLTVNISWDDGAATCTHSFTAITGDTTTTTGSESYMVLIDAPPISYSTTYASNTPGAMKYKLSVVLESIAV